MPLTKIAAENFTVFEDIKIPFCEGLNVLVGENGVGKTHIMKLAYAACQASKHDVSFSQKTTMLFRPDQSGIGRLVNRGKSGSNKAMVSVESDTAKIGMTFSTKTRKWDAEINSEEKWEKQMSDLTSVFIPAKEILSNAWNLDAAVKMGNVEFDDTYLDIIAAAKIDISRGVDSTVRKKYLDILQKISNGKVTLHEDRFYLKPGTQAKLEFNLVAEGLRKIALLWQLIKNGTLEKGSVLFWDEPEANINPKYIPVLAELLIMLETEGVQIFVSTHDYFLSKYIEVKRRQDSKLQYISLYKNENSKVLCDIVFLEAKKSCPNVANRYESKEKELKFEEYYGSITEKFISSLQIYLAAIMNRYQDTSEIGDNLRSVSNMKDVKLKFILVVKNAEDITWLAGPLAELRARLLKVRKIWGVEVVVLNEELAGEYNLTC